MEVKRSDGQFSLERHTSRPREPVRLRTAEALQLGAALVLAEGEPESMPFVCVDRSLAAAAEREGFPVLTWADA